MSADMQPVVAALKGLFTTVAGALGGQPGKKREIDDNSKRLGGLFWRLNANDVSEGVKARLQQLSAALSAGDIAGATQIQASFFSCSMSECHAPDPARMTTGVSSMLAIHLMLRHTARQNRVVRGLAPQLILCMLLWRRCS